MATFSTDNPALINLTKRRIEAATTQADIDDLRERIDNLYMAKSFSTSVKTELITLLNDKAAALVTA